jgi:orotate phosphoribosyltransferase
MRQSEGGSVQTTTNRIISELQRIGAIRTDDHFVYASGRHGSAYVDKDRVSANPVVMFEFAHDLARYFREFAVECVLGLPYGSISLANYVGYHLNVTERGRSGPYVLGVASAFAVKKGDDFEIRPSLLDLVEGKRVLIVEDILTTGGRAHKSVQITRSAGGTVVGVGALVNRGGVTAQMLGVADEQFYALTDFPLETYAPIDCPFCASAKPVNVKHGHGQKFLDSKPSARFSNPPPV